MKKKRINRPKYKELYLKLLKEQSRVLFTLPKDIALSNSDITLAFEDWSDVPKFKVKLKK